MSWDFCSATGIFYSVLVASGVVGMMGELDGGVKK